MAFIEYPFVKTHKIGDVVVTTREHHNLIGYMEVGTEVTVIARSGRGYDIRDAEGNEILEIGWII